ncbi:MAG: T9SS type A sorting domain-containing protein [Flavobacteriia bacterium]|jgi:hypothetical protein
MKKIFILLALNLIIFDFIAQNDNELYGIVRKNYYSLQTDPFDTSFHYEVFDSATIRLGKLYTNTGVVENISETGSAMAVNLTGAALNPYTNSFLFFGGDKFVTMNLNTGESTNSVNLFNPNGESYFDNFRFNNSDSTIYGLARRNFYDQNQSFTGSEMFLSKLNSETGEIQQISPNSIGNGFALAGSAIDPYQMVYYYSVGDAIVGLDMYSGEIFSSFPVGFGVGIMFDNFTYSCADTALYGLIRQNFYSTVYDSLFPDFPMQNLDSTSIKLGKMNTTSGNLEEISPVNLNFGGYSLNASSAIDPVSMTYYFSTGNNVVGVSMLTGLIVENNLLNFEDGSYFDLMRNFNNCKSAIRARVNAGTSSISKNSTGRFSISPNPTNSDFTIKFKEELKNGELSIINQLGEIVQSYSNLTGNELKIEKGNLKAGIYFVKLISETNNSAIEKICITE